MHSMSLQKKKKQIAQKMGGKSDGVRIQIWRVESRDGINQNTLYSCMKRSTNKESYPRKIGKTGNFTL